MKTFFIKLLTLIPSLRYEIKWFCSSERKHLSRHLLGITEDLLCSSLFCQLLKVISHMHNRNDICKQPNQTYSSRSAFRDSRRLAAFTWAANTRQQIVRRATKQTGVHDMRSTFYKSNQYLIKTQGHRLTRQWIFSPLACLLKTIRLISEKPGCVIGGKAHAGFMHLFSRWLFSKSLVFSLFFPAWPCTEGCLALSVFH